MNQFHCFFKNLSPLQEQIFCVIEDKKVFISDKAFLEIAEMKELNDLKKLKLFTHQEKILFCEKHFILQDLFEYKDGILFLGDINALHS